MDSGSALCCLYQCPIGDVQAAGKKEPGPEGGGGVRRRGLGGAYPARGMPTRPNLRHLRLDKMPGFHKLSQEIHVPAPKDH